MTDPLLAGMLAQAMDMEASFSFPSGIDAPSRVTSRVSGGLARSGTTSKNVTVVKVDCTDTRMCFGRIGVAGVAFCTRYDCSIKAHAEAKVGFRGLKDTLVFITQVEGSTAFVEPSLSESKVAPEVWSEWQSRPMNLKGWCREFEAVETTDDNLPTFADIKKETRFLDSADEFRTPAKRKRESEGDNPLMMGDLKSIRYERKLPTSIEQDDLETVLKPGILTKVVAGIETNMVLLGEGLEEVAILTAGRLEANEADLVMVSGLMRNVRSSIGSPFELDPTFVAPTLWGSVSFMADELLRVSAKVAKTIEAFLPFQTGTSERIGAVEDRSDTVFQLLESVMRTMAGLTAENKALRGVVAELQIKTSNIRPRSEMSEEERVEAMMEELRVKNKRPSVSGSPIGSSLPSMGGKGVSGGSDTHVYNALASRLAEMWTEENFAKFSKMIEEFGEMKRASEVPMDVDASGPTSTMWTEENFRLFTKMVDDVGTLKLSSEASAVKFGGLGLKSLQECVEWTKVNFSENHYGLIIDPLILLDRLYGNIHLDQMTQLKIYETQAKLKINNSGEASSLTSLGYPRPRFFHEGRPLMSCDQNTSRMSKLGKHNVWKNGNQGIRNNIMDRLSGLQSSITSDINHVYGTNPECATAKTIALMGLTLSVAFVTQLVNYIDSLFEQLHIHSKFTVDAGWSLTVQVLDRICEDLYSAKDGVTSGMQSDRASICAGILWSSLRTNDVAQQYIDSRFENHPSIASEFIKFLATNSGFEKVEQLAKEMALNTAKVLAVTTEIARASAKADTATSRVAELTREVATLTRRVGAAETVCATAAANNRRGNGGNN